MTSKVVRTMSSRHWESTFSSFWRRKTLLHLSSKEVPLRGGETGFANASLTSSEVQNFKKELWPLLEDPFGVSQQVDQFLGPQICTWTELISILGILFSGEERAMIHRLAMAIWECEHPLGQSVLAADVKSPNQDPWWDNNTPGHWKNVRDLIMRGLSGGSGWHNH
jgi:hypothetical protein